MVTIRDVARSAGVSVATASRVLTGAGPTSEATRQQVRQAAEELGYRVNKIARSLRTQRTDTIGLLIPDVRNPFFAELAYVIEQAAGEHGIAVITMSADEREDRQAQAMQTLANQQVDGLIVAPQGEQAPRDTDVPLIYVDRGVAGHAVPVVRSDDADGAAQMIDHLVDIGHRDIALITGPQATTTGSTRRATATARLTHHGCTTHAQWVQEGDFQLQSGRQATARILDADLWPTVIFAADNLMALGALLELGERGLRVGESIALTGFDDAPWFAALNPPLTVVAQDVPGLGTQALSALRSLIAGDDVTDIELPVHLQIRGSCALPTTPAPRETRTTRRST